jgi:D-alanine-D-alanine ligase
LRPSIVIVYNKPGPGTLGSPGEEKSVLGVLACVRAVYKALAKAGYPVSRIGLSPPLDKVREKLAGLQGNVIFNLFEGFPDDPQSESAVAAILEELHLSFTGCDSTLLSLALDKYNSKKLLWASGIDTPRSQLLNQNTINDFKLQFPCIIKPYAQDASLGITSDSVVRNFDALARQVDTICTQYQGKAIVEEYIDGREFNITVLGNDKPEVLPVSEIVFSLPPDMPAILTYEAKWIPDSVYFHGTKVICPAPIDQSLKDYINETAIKTYIALHCSGYIRLDLRMGSDQIMRVIEVNPNPDISPGTGAARQAKAAGMTYSQFIDKIVSLTLESLAV